MNPDRPSVSVIIVNYNAGAFLQRSVDSLAAQEDRDFELIIVDNNSTDGSIEAVRTDATPQTRVLRQPRNLGFAAANNLAAREARGEWLALLNPDAFAAPDWLARFRHLRSHFPQGKALPLRNSTPRTRKSSTAPAMPIACSAFPGAAGSGARPANCRRKVFASAPAGPAHFTNATCSLR
jgi:Predicted glycosyltransferases